jgi:hypothetical protein
LHIDVPLNSFSLRHLLIFLLSIPIILTFNPISEASLLAIGSKGRLLELTIRILISVLMKKHLKEHQYARINAIIA